MTPNEHMRLSKIVATRILELLQAAANGSAWDGRKDGVNQYYGQIQQGMGVVKTLLPGDRITKAVWER